YLETGADPAFDRTLDKLGMLARRRPRVIIELLLVWRKATIDISDEYPLEAGAGSVAAATADAASAKQPALSRAYYIVKERRSLVSVYILCRALGAVVGQLDSSHLEGDLGDRLEELVFGQVKGVNPANLRRSANRREIQDLYAQLIGCISEVRFTSMSDRFIAELERIPMVSSGNDERIVVLLHNMRFLKLRVFPIDALEESSAFLLSCAKFYSRTTGSLRLKHAWASLLTELLMPMAAVVDAEVNLPGLVQAVDIIYTKAMKMAAKVRHVTVSFPLAAAALCISRQDVFHQHWLSLLEFCIQRLKDKQFRRVSMDAILRMLWVYLFRYPEANAVVLRRIDSLSRIFFPATKLHAWPKTVPPSAFVYFLTCAACYNFEFAMRQLLKNMLQVDSGWPGTTRDIVEAGPFLDTLNPARVALAFQALVNVAAIASNRPASAAAATSTSEETNTSGSNGPAALHPPFPGNAQLSGLDVFDVGVLGSLTQGEAGRGSGGGLGGGSSNIGGHLGVSGAHSGGCVGGPLGNSLSVPGGAKSSSGAAAASSCVPGGRCEATQSLSIDPDALPDSIRSALITAIGVVTRYFNVLNPVFGNYVLADERLWRLTRTMPPMSSVVLTGSVFNFGNTVLAQSAAKSRDQQAAGSSASAAAAANGTAGVAGANGSTAVSAAAGGMSDDGGDGHYRMDGSGSLGNGGTTAHGGSISEGSGSSSSGSNSASADAAVNLLRQVVSRYPAERQVYLDLMAVYIRNVPRSRLFWEQTDVTRLIETMVQNILHVDQTVAAESRACLMDLLCPPSIRQPFRPGPKSAPFTRSSDRLSAIIQAVTRATQALRATDERFTEVLVGGVFSRDVRSCVPYARPGDPLPDTPGIWPFGMVQINGGRRFIHAANLSTTSNTSASAAAAAAAASASGLPSATGDSSSRSYTGTISDHDTREETTAVRQSLLLDAQSLNGDNSETEASASAASASGVKSRLHKSSHKSHASAVGELNGGFLHVFLDLIYYLEAALIEDLSESSTKTPSGKSAGSLSTKEAAASSEVDVGSGDADNGSSLAAGNAAAAVPADSTGLTDGAVGATDARKVAGHDLASWASLLSAIEANLIAYLCSSSVHARHLCVDILYQVGSLRRIIAAHEPLPPPGHTWIFRSSESAYEVLNFLVPRKQGSLGQPGNAGISVVAEGSLNAPLVSELWDVPFGTGDEHAGQQKQFRLAKLAASSRESDISMWLSHLPLFIRRACVLIPDVMLVARTLVCQRLYQMQPLMNQYADISVRASVYGMGAYFKLASGLRAGDKSALAPRADLVNAFGNLFLFAVVSLPTGDTALRNIASSGGSVFGDAMTGNRSPHGTGSSIFGNSSGNGANSSGSGNGGSGGGSSGGGGRSRLAKSIARKLAPLKSSSRGSKQEQGVGLASIAQLVRMASITLRSDNAPLRQQIAYAFCNTPPAYLQELMHELRPLSESLFDDGSSMASHKNYLHVSSAANSALSNSGLMASLGHGLSSPGGSAQHIGGGAAASGGNSPRSAAHQAYRAGSSILAAAQLATHSS
ncbi:Cell morphogenesis protein PAG1, partial [Coemansia sp. RSA 2607]